MMLKGHVFKKQIFGNQIFALFINTFLNGNDGISNNYKNGMKITYSGNLLTVQSGAVCIQGRFLEEDTYSDITVETEDAYCKLVIEIDLDKENTDVEFVQGTYKIVKNTNKYPELTQNNIVKNNSGIYQYELARFKSGSYGITEFKDMRTFLDFDSIYTRIETDYRNILEQLEKEFEEVQNGNAFITLQTNVETEMKNSGIVVSSTEPSGEDRKKVWIQNTDTEQKIYVKNDNDVYEEFINKGSTLDIYSKEEQVVGTWIDGKPIYRKAFTGTTDSSKGNVQLTTSNDIKYVLSVKGYIMATDGVCLVAGGSQNTTSETQKTRVIVLPANNLRFDYQTALCSCDYYIAVEYTKTTD